MTLAEARRYFVVRTAEWALSDKQFFVGVMAMIAFAQSFRILMPDEVFAIRGYDLLAAYFNENFFAFLLDLFAFGTLIRIYGLEFYRGVPWFTWVGRIAYVSGSFAYFLISIGVMVSIHAVGLQSIGFFFLATALLVVALTMDVK